MLIFNMSLSISHLLEHWLDCTILCNLATFSDCLLFKLLTFYCFKLLCELVFLKFVLEFCLYSEGRWI